MYLKKISGLNISGAVATAYKLNGARISPAYGAVDKLNGLSIAAVKNYSIKGRGVQSLQTICDDFKGIQVGIWNKNQKHSLPIINWNF
jgi:hypothetical protein